MSSRSACCLLAIALAQPAAYAHAQAALPPETLYEKLAPSIVMIGTFDAQRKLAGLGSGVVIGPGQVITNCHVLRKATSVYIKSGNASYKAALRHPDTERDLCQLEVQDLNSPAVEIGSIKQVRIGQKVYALGNPRGLERTLSDGLVSALRGENDEQMIQTTAPVSPGSSGGGLFDASGKLVGITTLARRDSANIAFAVPADWIAEVPVRAAEQLASYRGGLASAKQPGTSGRESNTGEKILAGSELVNLFSTTLVFTILEPALMSKLVFRTNGHYDAEFLFLRRSGTHRLMPSSNTVCINFDRSNNLPSLDGCYSVSQVTGKRYRFSSTDREFVIIGDL